MNSDIRWAVIVINAFYRILRIFSLVIGAVIIIDSRGDTAIILAGIGVVVFGLIGTAFWHVGSSKPIEQRMQAPAHKYECNWCPRRRRNAPADSADIQIIQHAYVCDETGTELLEIEVLPDHIQQQKNRSPG